MRFVSSGLLAALPFLMAGCECGSMFEHVIVDGNAVLTSSSGSSLQEVYTGEIADHRADGGAQSLFRNAKEAVKDPEGTTTTFGFQAVGLSASGVSGRGFLLELAFPLRVGVQLEFETSGQFSTSGSNAPFLQYVDVSSGTRTVIELARASGVIESTDPLSIKLSVDFVGGGSGDGLINLRYESMAVCD